MATIHEQELARAASDKRIIRVRLKVVEDINGNYSIVTELENSAINTLFNQRDFEDIDDLISQKNEAADNRTRKESNRPVSERGIPAGQRVHMDKYDGEPKYLHAGIHLNCRTRDEIEWFSDQPINFKIDLGPDPELYKAPANIGGDDAIPKIVNASTAPNNPFVDAVTGALSAFPKYVVSGAGVRSGALKPIGGAGADRDKLHVGVANQKYYKFNITVLGTDIHLDPHIDGHDE
jgi:hypothetical protein